jgi:hypothetical protein
MQYTPQRTVSQSEAADAFVRGNGHAVRTSSALRTTREVAYSYAEPVAMFDPDRPGTLLITTASFSRTTSKHVGAIRRAAEHHGVPHEDADHNVLHQLLGS